MCGQNQGMLVYKGLDDVQHRGEMEIICLCMSHFVSNLQYNPASSQL